ncbi:MAG: insulinase family protein [Candidatus Aminicenantes bacterium]|nr:insulinase family protein [Candidatus Aminicenantes bacterium]MDH5384847.1 insulinase family protein [Candidatus Aminicenantes bacterium]
MKRYILIFTIFVLFLSFLFAQKDPKTLEFPDIEFAPKKPGLAAVKEGVTFYFQEDYESPVIEGMLIFKSGSLYEPSGKEGLASLTMRMLKAGGTKTLTPDKLEDKLDFLGSTISSFGGLEFSQIRFWTLSKNFDETWKVLTDMLYNPGFDEERFETEKKKDLEMIRRRFDYPSSLGMYLFQELVYGKDFPEARRTTSTSINGITLDDVKAFYEKNIRDIEVIVAFTGDFKHQEILSLLEESFEDWKATAPADLDLPKAALATKPGVYFIDKPDMTQAIIAMGHLGLNNLDEANVEVNIFNFILGTGSFNSRLMREVRSNRGLAYATFGLVSLGRDKGVFFNFCQTKSQSVGEAIKLMKDIITDMTENPVSVDELDVAKKYEVNSFVHKFDSPQAVVRQAIYLKLDGYPDDYLETYLPRIKKVDADKLLAIGKRAVNPDDMVILVVGKKSEVLDQLKALGLGEVNELPLPKE